MRDSEGFSEYVAGQRVRLVRIGYLLTGDRDLAEDLIQTALVRVLPHWDRVARDGNIDAYFRKTVVSVYLSWRRRRWTTEIVTAEVPDQSIPDPYRHPGGIEQRVRALPPRQRAVIVLRYYLDLSEAETAETLGCAIGTVKSQAARALTTLRAHLGPADREEQYK
jgi:RNA polymerase sigma-70 factor (sigma-E family)